MATGIDVTRQVRALRRTFLPVFAAALALSSVNPATAQTRLTPLLESNATSIVIGFVGGFVHSDDIRHSEVQIIERLRTAYPSGVHVGIFENRQRERAFASIVHSLDRDNDGSLSDQEKRSARIILFGHSWGASAAIALARELRMDGIPVLLTIQVDSIAKNGQNDSVIPPNVAEAVNFYQTTGILHGRARITAADPSRTKILGDFRFNYATEPAECRDYPWYDRYFFKGHTSIECDPRVWSRVESLIRSQLPSTPSVAQTAVRNPPQN